MSEGIKVSVIIPVYNVELYLLKCLDSLKNQSLKEIEIICINDGSTDSSGKILDEYLKKDNRIQVINKINEGQGIARNIGIDIAKGEYIGFVDPDDWINADMFEKMYNQAKNINSDIVICDYSKHFEKSNKTTVQKFFKRTINPVKTANIKIDPKVNLDKNLLYKTLLVSPCYCVNRIYKKELLIHNDIKFDNLRSYEDVMFILKSHICAQNISYINEPFYTYRIRKNSTLRSYEHRYQDLLKVFDDIDKYIEKSPLKEALTPNISYFYVMGAVWVLRSLNEKKSKTDFLNGLSKYFNENDFRFLYKKLEKNRIKRFLFTILSASKTKEEILEKILYYF